MWVARHVQAGVQIPKTSGLALQSTWRARAAGLKGGINILEPDEQLGGRSSSSRGTKALRRRPLASSKMHLFLMRANRCKASSSPS